MSNPNKAKGTKWETDLVGTLDRFAQRAHGIRPRRVAQAGHADTGDVHGVEPFVLQAKDDRSFSLSAWLDGPKGVITQAFHAGEPYGAVVVKRPRRAVGDAYTILRYQDFARVLLRLRRAEELLAQASPALHFLHAEQTAEERLRPFPRASELALDE